MITCTRKIHFCSGHRVFGHESKCANLHGHNYVAWIEASAQDLDTLGRVIDFGELKVRMGTWIDEHWDHRFLLFKEDPAIHLLSQVDQNKSIWIAPFNPTAENMADYLLRVVSPQVMAQTGIQITKIQLFETENCYALSTL